MLSKKTKYAINALVNLAYKKDQGNVLISQVAEEEKIPKKFLEAILLELKNAGILNSRKGKGGGYYLKKDPSEVKLADIIRMFDGAIALLPCVSANYYEKCAECKDETLCGIRDVFQEAHRQTLIILEQSTLADIIAREKRLKNK